MNKFKFKTNINCGGCLSKVTPLLNQSEGISHWEVDLENQDKILSASTTGMTPAEIIRKIEQAGYTAQEIK